MDIRIQLEPRQRQFLTQVMSEAFDGGSTQVIQAILSDRVEAAAELRPHLVRLVEAGGKTLALTRAQWRVVYEVVNAVIYGLGPFELRTCTGVALQDALNVNLRICAEAFGAYGKMRWE